MDITSKAHTFFKKKPLPVEKLSNADKAKVYQGRTFKIKRILENRDRHTWVCLGALGEWWVEDSHWSGLTSGAPAKPYAKKDDLIYLQDFPYNCLDLGDLQETKQSLSYCIFAWMSHLAPSETIPLPEYINLVLSNNPEFIKHANKKALSELGWSISFTKSADPEDIKKELKNGRPVIAGIAYDGPSTLPSRFGYYVLITGHTESAWLVQDSIGQLELVNGRWIDLGGGTGRNVLYDFAHFNPRLFFSGGATGQCFMRLSKREP